MFLPFGWNIFDTNRTVGGLLGYSSVNSTMSLNVPETKEHIWDFGPTEDTVEMWLEESLSINSIQWDFWLIYYI